MNVLSRPVRAGAPAAPAPRTAGGSLRFGLCALLVAGGVAAALVALNLESVLARYDTLDYLRSGPGARLTLLRGLLGAGGVMLAGLGVIALRSIRLSVGLLGGLLLLVGSAAGPAAARWLAAGRGLEESLIYRLRTLADVGWIGGIFLVFLSLLPGILALPPGRVERVLTGALGSAAERYLALPPWRRRGLLGILVLGAVLAVGLGVLADFPNSSDESSYLTQARIFATGRLWVEAPSQPDFFRARSLILDAEGGRFFAKAFPGWSALLSLGVRAGAPWLVNPVLSAVTVALFAWVAAMLLGPGGEVAALGLLIPTPFFLLNSASYFNHAATLLFITLFLAAVLRSAAGSRPGWAWIASASAGVVVTMRPAAAAALAGPLLLWLGVKWWRDRRWKSLMGLGIPLALTLAVLGAYNRLMFGSPFRTGYAAYDPADIRAGLGADNLLMTGWWLLKLAMWTLPGCLAGVWFLGRGRRLGAWARQEPIPALMALSLALLAGIYLVFQNKGGNEYGPRYYYDGFGYLVLLLTAGWMRAESARGPADPERQMRRGVRLGAAVSLLLAVAGANPLILAHYADKIDHNRDLFVQVGNRGLKSALVFLETGSGRMPPGDLLRNPLDFRSGVVYARDLGPDRNGALAAAYPDRPSLIYAYDPFLRRSTLRRLEREDRP